MIPNNDLPFPYNTFDKNQHYAGAVTKNQCIVSVTDTDTDTDYDTQDPDNYEIAIITDRVSKNNTNQKWNPMQRARIHDQSAMQVEGKPNAFRVPVCVLCDRLIIGCETIHKIKHENLQKQSARISVTSYEDYYQVKMSDELVSQYHINDLEGLLLSPRAKQGETESGIVYDACSNCTNSWAKKGCDSPPKHAIANGFAIGHVPESVIVNEKITEEMCALLSPVRAFGYIFAYSAGAHKAIRGHFSFFEVDLTHTGTVLNHHFGTKEERYFKMYKPESPLKSI